MIGVAVGVNVLVGISVSVGVKVNVVVGVLVGVGVDVGGNGVDVGSSAGAEAHPFIIKTVRKTNKRMIDPINFFMVHLLLQKTFGRIFIHLKELEGPSRYSFWLGYK